MSIIGNCIKTGAVVTFIEYGQTFAADLFKVGGSIVIRIAPDSFGSEAAFKHQRPATHEVFVGSTGLLDKRGGIAVVPAESLIDLSLKKGD